eukprot:2728098-Rhodomonas_salina.4
MECNAAVRSSWTAQLPCAEVRCAGCTWHIPTPSPRLRHLHVRKTDLISEQVGADHGRRGSEGVVFTFFSGAVRSLSFPLAHRLLTAAFAGCIWRRLHLARRACSLWFIALACQHAGAASCFASRRALGAVFHVALHAYLPSALQHITLDCEPDPWTM